MAYSASSTMSVFLETSHTARSQARTGIQTVVRGLAGGFSSQGVSWLPVRWSFKKEALTPLKRSWERNLGLPGDGALWLPPESLLRARHWSVWKESLGMSYKTPLDRHPAHGEQLSSSWLLLPELMEGCHVRRVAAYARRQGMRVAAIFHDAIAWLHPEMVRHWTQEQHRDYMEALTELDVVVAVSTQAQKDFHAFVESQKLPEPRLAACPLAAEIPGERRETSWSEPSGTVLKILCVSTLEPRKNHRQVVEAFQRATARLPAAALELHLAGAEYPSAPEIAGFVREKTQTDSRIFWHESVAAEDLRKLYRGCAFTVFGSGIEGFGLPVLESLWFGKPCLCSDEGVMAENAVAGGCLIVDVFDTQALAEGMVQLAAEPGLRRKLGEEAVTRPLKTWKDYSRGILEILAASC